MKALHMATPFALFISLFAAAAPAKAANECKAQALEIEALKQHVLTLETQLAQQRSNHSTVASPTTASASAEAQLQVKSPNAAPATLPQPTNAITRKVVVLEEEAYSRTGCSLGLFKGSPPGLWKELDHWSDLERGMPAGQVEALLGIEHYNEGNAQRVIWHYGRCGTTSGGQVLLVNGRVEEWRTPRL